MASTPPLQITATPDTPLTPLHGALYDRQSPYSTRQTTRKSPRFASRESHLTPDAAQHPLGVEPAVATPRSSRQTKSRAHTGIRSPQSTPRNKSARRVQVLSPPSPDDTTSAVKPPPTSKSYLQPFASSSTTMNEGMLPTPVKTPKKKMVAHASTAARALFQDSTLGVPALAQFEPSPRRKRKNKRYNGFSLESFTAEDEGGRSQIQIFTDSRDQIPQADNNKANPFVEQPVNEKPSSAGKVVRTSKRRKLSSTKKLDRQVEEAIEKDEGMVYVFRGKKVYRRFNDDNDEEEEIDTDDLGLLEHTPQKSNPRQLKTLTRRSIKPKRLFQTEAQKRAREADKEEEALTDIEEVIDLDPESPTDVKVPRATDTETPSKRARSLRSTIKADTFTGEAESSQDSNPGMSKKLSPFDAWPRVKSGGRPGPTTPKGKKRGAAEMAEVTTPVGNGEPKRTRT